MTLALARTSRLLQGASAAGLLFVVVMAQRSPVRAESNVGASTMWLLWWPLIPFLALAAGRLWCAACPFAALSDLVDGLAGRLRWWRRPAPGRLTRLAGAAWLPLSMVLLGIAFLALGLEMSGPMTVAVVGVFAAGSAGLALLLRGRAWCRFACPLGASLGLYAPLSAWSLTPKTLASGLSLPPVRCPSALNPRRSISPQHCQLCASCVDVGAASITPQPAAVPALDGASAALAIALAGVLAADTVRMTPLFLSYVDLSLSVLGAGSYRLSVALLPVVASAVVSLVVYAVGRRAGWRTAASALIPAALAAQLGLSLQHLTGSGWPTLQGLAIELLPLPWEGHLPPANAYTVIAPLKAIQLALIGAGLVLSLRMCTPRSSRVAATGASLSFAGLFLLPMSLAC